MEKIMTAAIRKVAMTRAWEIARTMVGDMAARLSYALKQAWAEAKTAANLITECNIRLREDGNLAVNGKTPNKIIDTIKSMKPIIIDLLTAEKEAEEKAYEIRLNKIASIEGLKEIQEAQNELSEWNKKFNASFEDVGGMGVGAKPQYDINAMLAQYPIAAAYLKAERYENKSDYRFIAVGKEAKERIINNPQKYASIIAQMDRKISKIAEGRLWD